MKDLITVFMRAKSNGRGDYLVIDGKKIRVKTGAYSFTRDQLFELKRDEIRPIARRHAIETNANIDRGWLWNANSKDQAAFLLGDPVSDTFPLRRGSRNQDGEVGRDRNYSKQEIDREKSPGPETMKPQPTATEGIRVDVHFHIHWL